MGGPALDALGAFAIPGVRTSRHLTTHKNLNPPFVKGDLGGFPFAADDLKLLGIAAAFLFSKVQA